MSAPKDHLPTTPAMVAFGVYAGLALGVGHTVPFVRFPAFTFRVAEGAVATPLFAVNGGAVPCEDYGQVALEGGPPALRGTGTESNMEHALAELEACLAARAGTGVGAGEPVEVGFRLVESSRADGLVITEQVQARGRAWKSE